MSKSYKNRKDKLTDEYNRGQHKASLRHHRKEKRIVNSLRSLDVSSLIEEDY